MKNHLKRVTTPKTWTLSRRGKVFTTCPHPSGHPRSQGMPLGVLIRDVLHLALTMSEVKKVLNNKEVLVDGKRRKDHRFLVGLFDVLSFPALGKQYRLVLDENGHLALVTIKADEAKFKLGKVVGKNMIKKGLIQYHLHDGRNLTSDQVSAVGDSLLITVPEQKIQKIFPLQKGMTILLDAGKHAGKLGSLKNLVGYESTYATADGDVETVTKYIFVVGDKEPALTVSAAVHDKKSN
ncbi:30S ribosomal protein S4e [Candidatus Woesearchaeota archaeon]|nr:30S ribosomal protein S4e [Candidatus Woesearchaeota archaeon]